MKIKLILYVFTLVALLTLFGCGDSPKQEFKDYSYFNNSTNKDDTQNGNHIIHGDGDESEDGKQVKVGKKTYSVPSSSEFAIFYNFDIRYWNLEPDKMMNCTTILTSKSGNKTTHINGIHILPADAEFVDNISNFTPIQENEEMEINVRCPINDEPYSGVSLDPPAKAILKGGKYVVIDFNIF